MTIAKINRLCTRCLGAGQEEVSRDLNGNPVLAPCSACRADGWVEGDTLQLDTTAIMAELDYIHGKVTAIWNAVKPPG